MELQTKLNKHRDVLKRIYNYQIRQTSLGKRFQTFSIRTGSKRVQNPDNKFSFEYTNKYINCIYWGESEINPNKPIEIIWHLDTNEWIDKDGKINSKTILVIDDFKQPQPIPQEQDRMGIFAINNEEEIETSEEENKLGWFDAQNKVELKKEEKNMFIGENIAKPTENKEQKEELKIDLKEKLTL